MPSPRRYDCPVLVIFCTPSFVFAQVAVGVNGPVLEVLTKASGHQDTDIINVFRKGGDLTGVLDFSGNGTVIVVSDADKAASTSKIAELTTVAANTKLVKSLRVDEHAEKLSDTVSADAALGRMSKPVSFTPDIFMKQDLNGRCFSKAFTVEQGTSFIYLHCSMLCSFHVLFYACRY